MSRLGALNKRVASTPRSRIDTRDQFDPPIRWPAKIATAWLELPKPPDLDARRQNPYLAGY